MASAAAASAANSLRSGGKAVRNSGRALFNSMKNLSLVRSGSNLKPTKDESEWESKWDDDEDSDSDESEAMQESKIPAETARSALSQPSEKTQMNGGHHVVSYQHQQPPLPQQPAALQPQDLPTNLKPQPTKQPSAKSVTDDEEGLEWDTLAGTGPTQPPVYEKPNVQMFLPLLRVLGKGSFGKVSQQRMKSSLTSAKFSHKGIQRSSWYKNEKDQNGVPFLL